MKPWIWFVVLTIVCWGAYVPMIHTGQMTIGGKRPSLWAFLFVGAAYFVVAVIVPLVLLAGQKELGNLPNARGSGISLFAGVLGAAGALGVILALMTGGTPQTVPPLVFAGAPIVATLIAMILHRPEKMPELPFYLGIVLAAAGAGLVLRYKPA